LHKTTCFFPLFHNYHKTFFTIITTTTTSESSVFPSELVPSPPIPIPLPLSFLYVLACWLECFQKSALARSFQTAHTQDRHCSSVSLWHPQQEERIASNLENKILSAKSATFVAIPTLHDSHFLRSGLLKEKCSHFLLFFWVVCDGFQRLLRNWVFDFCIKKHKSADFHPNFGVG
jgi:hypothetical protein